MCISVRRLRYRAIVGAGSPDALGTQPVPNKVGRGTVSPPGGSRRWDACPSGSKRCDLCPSQPYRHSIKSKMIAQIKVYCSLSWWDLDSCGTYHPFISYFSLLELNAYCLYYACSLPNVIMEAHNILVSQGHSWGAVCVRINCTLSPSHIWFRRNLGSTLGLDFQVHTRMSLKLLRLLEWNKLYTWYGDGFSGARGGMLQTECFGFHFLKFTYWNLILNVRVFENGVFWKVIHSSGQGSQEWD
jgi:hypothetical protein